MLPVPAFAPGTFTIRWLVRLGDRFFAEWKRSYRIVLEGGVNALEAVRLGPLATSASASSCHQLLFVFAWQRLYRRVRWTESCSHIPWPLLLCTSLRRQFSRESQELSRSTTGGMARTIHGAWTTGKSFSYRLWSDRCALGRPIPNLF